MHARRTIQVDHTERAEALLRCLAEDHRFEITIAQLPLGDYVIGGRVLIERKTTRDFAVSLLDGRLFDQAYRLVNDSEESLMVVEGASFRTDVEVAMSALRGALISMAQTYRLPVIRTRDQQDTAWTFARLHDQRLRVGRNRGPLQASRRASLQARKERVLRTIPGIGPKMARALLDRFGSVGAVLCAPPEELARVKGFGPRRISALRDTVMEDGAPWDSDVHGGDLPMPLAGDWV